ncbi:MAG: glycosyltransferase [Bacteroidota bacterium]
MESNPKKKSLYIFSTDLPKGLSDLFMLPELSELSERNINISLFPFYKGENAPSLIHPKIIVNECMVSYKEDGKIDLRLFTLFIKVVLIDLYYNKNAFWTNVKNIRKTFSYFKSLYFKSAYLINKVREFEPNAIYYSYWWVEWNLILIILKLQGKLINPKIVTRTHNFDLYTERQNNYIPFRGLQLFYTDTIYTISKNGSNYLKSKYPKFENKVVNFYLGTKDNGYSDNKININQFNLISVSDFRDVKRVWLIPEILKYITQIDLKWTHIGTGKGIEDFQRKMTETLFPENISYEFKGFIKNNELYNLYKQNDFHLFINVSSYEGLPVSIMEAISMGVPAVATDVGGTKEIINDETGFLIPKDFDPKKVAEEITHFLLSINNKIDYKKRAREFWEKNFKDEKNCNDFANHLLS